MVERGDGDISVRIFSSGSCVWIERWEREREREIAKGELLLLGSLLVWWLEGEGEKSSLPKSLLAKIGRAHV